MSDGYQIIIPNNTVYIIKKKKKSFRAFPYDTRKYVRFTTYVKWFPSLGSFDKRLGKPSACFDEKAITFVRCCNFLQLVAVKTRISSGEQELSP